MSRRVWSFVFDARPESEECRHVQTSLNHSWSGIRSECIIDLSIDAMIVDLKPRSQRVGVVGKWPIADAAVRTDTITTEAEVRVEQHRFGKSAHIEVLRPVRLGASKSALIL